MRLLHAATIKVVEFMGAPPPYAILSHMWEEEEVTLQDLERQDGRAMQKKGYFKLEKSCQLAIKSGYDYIWVDTCCIDKTSSAEPSEAINSMFRWYKEAEACFAFLSDVVRDDLTDIEKSRWFTRGWTLQELIAPQDVELYNSSWRHVGSRNQNQSVFQYTLRIPYSVLSGEGLSDICLRERMQWASTRTTTRPEDMAYCLLGIFDVNMPLLYGEGKQKAFKRLQEEIIKSSNDLSIFLWTVPVRETDRFKAAHWGLFASDPAHFTRMDALAKKAGDIEQLQDTSMDINNKGIGVQWVLYPIKHSVFGIIFHAMLVKVGFISYGIFVKQVHNQETQFFRIFPEQIGWVNTAVQPWVVSDGGFRRGTYGGIFGWNPERDLFAIQPTPQSVRIQQVADLEPRPPVLPQGFSMYRSTFPSFTAGAQSGATIDIKYMFPHFRELGTEKYDNERWYARIPSTSVRSTPGITPRIMAVAGFALCFSETAFGKERKVWVIVGIEASPGLHDHSDAIISPWSTLFAGDLDIFEAMKRVESLWPNSRIEKVSFTDNLPCLRCKFEKITRVSGIWYDIKLEEDLSERLPMLKFE